MGRKSLAKERRTEIINAFERCVAKYGLQRTTLENIADEAGLNRGLIHHYVGNRDDVIQVMLDRFLTNYRQSFESYASLHPNRTPQEILVDYFFDAWLDLGPEDDAIISELMAESERNSDYRMMLLELYRTFHEQVAEELMRAYPEASFEECKEVSYSFISLAYGSATMYWLGFRRQSQVSVRKLALELISSLGKT